MSEAMGFFFQGTQERVRNSRSKRSIDVRAIEVLLYIVILTCLFSRVLTNNTSHFTRLFFVNDLAGVGGGGGVG